MTKSTAPAPNTTPKAPVTAPPITNFVLSSLLPTPGALGSAWEDQGDPGTSLDLTNPPPQCAPFTPILATRTETVIHEWSFMPTADGSSERGHLNFMALRAASAGSVSDELAAVAQPSFAPSAEASAVRRFQEVDNGSITAVSAQIIHLPVSGSTVVWRAIVTSNTTAGAPQTTYMDVAYFGAANVMVKVRVALCGCSPPATATAPLMSGELGALQSIATTLAKGAPHV